MITDANGLPLVVRITPAHVRDEQPTIEMLRNIPPIQGPVRSVLDLQAQIGMAMMESRMVIPWSEGGVLVWSGLYVLHYDREGERTVWEPYLEFWRKQGIHAKIEFKDVEPE